MFGFDKHDLIFPLGAQGNFIPIFCEMHRNLTLGMALLMSDLQNFDGDKFFKIHQKFPTQYKSRSNLPARRHPL
jgi:hypothetical protein